MLNGLNPPLTRPPHAPAKPLIFKPLYAYGGGFIHSLPRSPMLEGLTGGLKTRMRPNIAILAVILVAGAALFVTGACFFCRAAAASESLPGMPPDVVALFDKAVHGDKNALSEIRRRAEQGDSPAQLV